MFSIFKDCMLRLASMGGGLQADINFSDYAGLVDDETGVRALTCSNGSCILATSVGYGNSNTNGAWLAIINGNYTSITVDSTFHPDVTGKNYNIKGLFALWGNYTVGTFINEGYLVIETGDVMRVGLSSSTGTTGHIDTLINRGIMTSDKAYSESGDSEDLGYAISVNTTGSIGQVINEYGAIMGNILVSAGGSIDTITNDGTIESITNDGTIESITNTGTITNGITSTSDSIIDIYNYGTIGLNSSGYQLSGNFNISEWYFVIDEPRYAFNGFTGSGGSGTSHMIVDGSVTLTDDVTLIIAGLGNNFSYGDNAGYYSLSKLIYTTDGATYDDDTIWNALDLSSDLKLEYELLRTDDSGNEDDSGEYFLINKLSESDIANTINKNFKNSPAHLFYQNTISQLDNIVHQTELTMYSNAKCHNTDTQYSESDDDCFFFTPFITHNNIYNSGDGLSYGFVSGYNKQLEHSLFGVHIGFSYGNVESDYLSNYLDMDTMLLLLGLHYRYMFDNNFYIKLRGDLFYAMHDVKGNYITSDPDSLGLNIGASIGAQIHIDKESPLYGVVDIETGIRYTGLNNSAFVFDADYNGVTYQESHKSSFTNLAYFDINAKYDKYLGDSNQWTINTVIGAQMLISSLPEIETTAIATKSHTTKSDIDINEIEGYVLFGIDYKVSNNVSLMLNYLGIYGNNSMSNSGFFNVRVWW